MLISKQAFFSIHCLFFPRKELWDAFGAIERSVEEVSSSTRRALKAVWLLGSAWVFLLMPTFAGTTPVKVALLGLQAGIKMLEATGMSDLCKEMDWKEEA